MRDEPPSTLTQRRYTAALNRLAKWRAVFAGWQLGTRAMTDPEAQAVRDQRELLLVLRVEVTALTRLLIERGLLHETDIMLEIITECDRMQQDLERRFPGFSASADGMTLDTARAAETMKGWRP